MMPQNERSRLRFSLRAKIPFRVVMLVFLTTFVVAAALIWVEADALRRDHYQRASLFTQLLAQQLAPLVLREDLWRAFEWLDRITAEEKMPPDWPRRVIVVKGERIWVSSDPERFPLQLAIASAPLSPEVQGLVTVVAEGKAPGGAVANHFFATAIADGGVTLGVVLAEVAPAALEERVAGMWRRGALWGVSASFLVALLAAWWGRELARPLERLVAGMKRLAAGDFSVPPMVAARRLTEDEIDDAFAALRALAEALAEAKALEARHRFDERLAALGRLSAAVAHEINNPLSGMLQALQNWRRDPTVERGERTVALLERGLRQIRDTVQALLVDVRSEGLRPLTRADWDDVALLAQAYAHGKACRFTFCCDAQDDQLRWWPSSPVRQVLLNLLFNAIDHTPESGWIEAHAEVSKTGLVVTVANSGGPIDASVLQRLFEPMASQKKGGHGLGLWVCYRIVTQLGGRIEVENGDTLVRFIVFLPRGTQ